MISSYMHYDRFVSSQLKQMCLLKIQFLAKVNFRTKSEEYLHSCKKLEANNVASSLDKSPRSQSSTTDVYPLYTFMGNVSLATEEWKIPLCCRARFGAW